MDNLVEFVAGRRKKWASLVAQPVDNLPYNAGDVGSVPEWGRSPGEGHGNPLEDSCLGNFMDRGAFLVMVHRVTKSWTGQVTKHAHKINFTKEALGLAKNNTKLHILLSV